MNNKKNDEFWMQQAIELAVRAKIEGEVPVGAILVMNDVIIGKGWNCSIRKNDPTAHAEIISLRQGGSVIRNYRLLRSVLYITLEPCIMCAGAIIHARIGRLVFGAKNNKKGAAGSLLNIFNNKYGINNDSIDITSGILETECSLQLKEFFSSMRIKF